MNHNKLASQMFRLTLVALLLTACSAVQPTSTPVLPTTMPPTAIPPTPTLPTPVPPTAIPPSPVLPTPVPPTPTAPTRIPPTVVDGLNPSGRAYISMAYDKESDRVILFGGQTGDYQDPASHNGETWTYNVAANKWTQMRPSSGPGKRVAAELVYNTKSDRVLLFGGSGWSDTWVYDFNTNTWQEMAPGPSGHLGYRMAYDAESDRVILFGGYDTGNRKFFDDTWTYDFNSNTWTEMKPSTNPPPRNFHVMAYDAESDRVIMWGGDVKDSDPSVWAYDYNKNTWQKMAFSVGPSPRPYASMVYNPKADRMILYGGDRGGDETWAYDYNANRWTKLEPRKVPGELSRHAMVYSTAADRVILFGGQIGWTNKYTEETWTYDLNANTWTNVTSHP